MKKIFVTFFALSALAFSSCNSSAKTEDTAIETAKTEVVKSERSEVITQFENLVDRAIELENRVADGDEDQNTATEYQELQKEVIAFIADHKDTISTLDADQQAQFQQIVDRIPTTGTQN